MIALIIIALFLVAELKTSRADGEIIRKMHPYRRIMSFIMPTRNESLVFFDEYIDAGNLLAFLEKKNEEFPVDITHCLLGALFIALRENPEMNRFVVGRRLYQRKDITVTFSMKRIKKNKKAKLAAVKIVAKPDFKFRELCASVQSNINVERSDETTYADKELGFFFHIPRPILRFCVGFFRVLDYYNLLPPAFIANDALYTSIFLANLGSLDMKAGFHHLYEWGNCPLFAMVGKIEERPVCIDGQVLARKMLHVRFTFDERIDDGLTARGGIETFRQVLEDPFLYFEGA